MKKGFLIALLCVGVVAVATVSFGLPVEKVAAAPKPGV